MRNAVRMSYEAIADLRESILDTKKFANMLQTKIVINTSWVASILSNGF